jgi:hypothetical protein
MPRMNGSECSSISQALVVRILWARDAPWPPISTWPVTPPVNVFW